MAGSIILTFLIVTYANDLAQYISGYFFVSACLLADGISVYKFKGDFLNEKMLEKRVTIF